MAGGPIPDQWLALAAAATLFAVMFDLGLGIGVGDFRWVLRRPALLARAVFSVLIAVPALALVVVRVFDLPRAADIGIVLMAISPGAPVALRRSLDAGGHRSFAPALQVAVALLAVVSMPLSVSALDRFYSDNASAAPSELARQVFFAQLLPLALGMLARRLFPGAAARFDVKLSRIANLLLVALTVLVLIDVWQVVVDAGPRIVLAITTLTLLALAAGHGLGGPEPATRTAVAIGGATRNAGLALLVATLNGAPPAIIATVMAYLVVSAFIVLAYALWRRHTRPRPEWMTER